MVTGGGVSWVFEEEGPGPGEPDEFAEIPLEVREQVEEEVRGLAFERLHAEAVARGDLPAPPRPLFDGLPGRAAGILFQLACGAAIGALAAAIVVYSIRTFTTIL